MVAVASVRSRRRGSISATTRSRSSRGLSRIEQAVRGLDSQVVRNVHDVQDERGVDGCLRG